MSRIPFGEHLKREREMRGVSLEEISAATRISTRFLEALETEQWDRLPGGVFNRGFIRAVARFLGLDEENLIAEYALETDDHPEVAVWADGPASSRRGRLGVLLIVMALGLIAAAGWMAYRHASDVLAAWQRISRAATARGRPAPSPPPPAITAGGTLAPAAESPSPPTSASAPAVTSETPASSPPKPLVLKVEAGKTAQVKIVADGKTVYSGRFLVGESKQFEAQESFRVFSTESSALVLELNGQTMPPLGPPGQPGSLTLTRNDLKKPPGGPN